MSSRLALSLRQLQRLGGVQRSVVARALLQQQQQPPTAFRHGPEMTYVAIETLTQRQHAFTGRHWLSSTAGSEKTEEKTDGEPKTDQEPKAEDGAQASASAADGEAPSAEGDGSAAAAAEGDDVAAEPEPTKEEQLEAQVKELKNQLLRSYAEQENTRKIAVRDVESAKQFAIKSFAKSLLDVSDNLSRAMESVPEEARADKSNTVLATLYEGIELTDRGLLKAFESNGLVRYGEVGEPFDPNKHDALYEYPDPEKKPGTIGQVMKPGFFLHKRVLRPAEVGVVKEG